ncbi:uncharacterized protein LOC142541412 [Primulina tabacum]|uniref:uncharacterized protein LOC142541412 n=1 Tax=Primulina tabacum TaxID=48773 RepID=UPI003F5A4D0B
MLMGFCGFWPRTRRHTAVCAETVAMSTLCEGGFATGVVCCVPMKQLVADDKACLCKVINNPGILQSLNITKTDAVNLAKNCGASADLSVCNKIVIPSPGSTPSAPSNGTTPSPPPKSAASAASFHHVAAYPSLPVAVLIFTKSSN